MIDPDKHTIGEKAQARVSAHEAVNTPELWPCCWETSALWLLRGCSSHHWSSLMSHPELPAQAPV